jgi:hypothetical protein
MDCCIHLKRASSSYQSPLHSFYMKRCCFFHMLEIDSHMFMHCWKHIIVQPLEFLTVYLLLFFNVDRVCWISTSWCWGRQYVISIFRPPPQAKKWPRASLQKYSKEWIP